jgi:hypothetical protein
MIGTLAGSAALAWYGSRVARDAFRWALGRPDASPLWDRATGLLGALARPRWSRRRLDLLPAGVVRDREGLYGPPDASRAMGAGLSATVRRTHPRVGWSVVVTCPATETAAVVSRHPSLAAACAALDSLTLSPDTNSGD